MGTAGSALPPCRGVQIKVDMLLVQLVSLLIIVIMMMYVQMCAIIRGECGCAVASLWYRHVPSCSLAIGPQSFFDNYYTSYAILKFLLSKG